MTPDRFNARLSKVGECWEWRGAIDTRGYGHFRHDGKIIRAHRYAFEMENGAIPSGQHVLHVCDNRRCCNPSHLVAGTHADNMADMREKGRRKNIGCGEENGRSRLTMADVQAIRADARGEIRLSRVYGVSPAQIQRIRAGKQWSHV